MLLLLKRKEFRITFLSNGPLFIKMNYMSIYIRWPMANSNQNMKACIVFYILWWTWFTGSMMMMKTDWLRAQGSEWVFTLQSLCAILLARALLAIYTNLFFFFLLNRVILHKLNYCSFEQFNCIMMVKLLFGKTVKYYSDIYGEGCPRQHGIGVKVKAKTTSNVIKILKHIC